MTLEQPSVSQLQSLVSLDFLQGARLLTFWENHFVSQGFHAFSMHEDVEQSNEQSTLLLFLPPGLESCPGSQHALTQGLLPEHRACCLKNSSWASFENYHCTFET